MCIVCDTWPEIVKTLPESLNRGELFNLIYNILDSYQFQREEIPALVIALIAVYAEIEKEKLH